MPPHLMGSSSSQEHPHPCKETSHRGGERGRCSAFLSPAHDRPLLPIGPPLFRLHPITGWQGHEWPVRRAVTDARLQSPCRKRLSGRWGQDMRLQTPRYSNHRAAIGCATGPLRIVVFVLALGLLWILASLMSAQGGLFNRMRQLLSGPQELPTTETQPRRYKCGLPMPCPDKHFAFRIVSGAANVIGPKFCLEDRVFMSSVKNNVGRGLNIALVNGVTGELIDTKFFDMWAGDTGITDLLKFLRPIYEGTLVFVASYDDPATKMNEEAKKIFSELGSKAIHMLGFRDSWVFVGAKGIDNKSPFEQHVKNDKNTNKYEGWPEAVEMEGCIPHKQV